MTNKQPSNMSQDELTQPLVGDIEAGSSAPRKTITGRKLAYCLVPTFACLLLVGLAAGGGGYAVFKMLPTDAPPSDNGNNSQKTDKAITDTVTGITMDRNVEFPTKEDPKKQLFLLGLGVRYKKIAVNIGINAYTVGLYVDRAEAKERLQKYESMSDDDKVANKDLYLDLIKDTTYSFRLIVANKLVDSKRMKDAMEESLKPRMNDDGLYSAFESTFDQEPIHKGSDFSLTCDKKGNAIARIGDQVTPFDNAPHLCKGFADMYLDDKTISPIAKKEFARGVADLYTRVCTANKDAKPVPETVEEPKTKLVHQGHLNSFPYEDQDGNTQTDAMNLLGVGSRYRFDVSNIVPSKWSHPVWKILKSILAKIHFGRSFSIGLYVSKKQAATELCRYRKMSAEDLATGGAGADVVRGDMTRTIQLQMAKDMSKKTFGRLMDTLMVYVAKFDETNAYNLVEKLQSMVHEEYKKGDSLFMQCSPKHELVVKSSDSDVSEPFPSQELCEGIFEMFVGSEPAQDDLKKTMTAYTGSIWAPEEMADES